MSDVLSCPSRISNFKILSLVLEQIASSMGKTVDFPAAKPSCVISTAILSDFVEFGDLPSLRRFSFFLWGLCQRLAP